MAIILFIISSLILRTQSSSLVSCEKYIGKKCSNTVLCKIEESCKFTKNGQYENILYFGSNMEKRVEVDFEDKIVNLTGINLFFIASV